MLLEITFAQELGQHFRAEYAEAVARLPDKIVTVNNPCHDWPSPDIRPKFGLGAKFFNLNPSQPDDRMFCKGARCRTDSRGGNNWLLS
jgi:hypothetical protein